MPGEFASCLWCSNGGVASGVEDSWRVPPAALKVYFVQIGAKGRPAPHFPISACSPIGKHDAVVRINYRICGLNPITNPDVRSA